MAGGDVFSFNDRLWAENAFLHSEIDRLCGELARREDVSRALGKAQARVGALLEQNQALRRQLADAAEAVRSATLAAAAAAAEKEKKPPDWAKANTPAKTRKTPGRKAGHVGAFRPVVEVDVHQQVPLAVDGFGKACCPDCRSQLTEVAQHERIVEELIPARSVVTCYHTTSGWCGWCRKTVESRGTEQPPPPVVGQDWVMGGGHGQLGLNALVTAAMLRVCYRLPMRLVSRLYGSLLGMKLSPGAVAKQLQRLGGWLEGQYHRLKLSLRLSGVVYADETSWRTDGKNAQLWTLTDPLRTLYHIDPSRGGKVIAGLLGKHFNADGKSTLVSDFYAVYDSFDGPQQKCLAHLLRELKQTAEGKPELKHHPFFTRCRRLIREMLGLRAQRDKLAPEPFQEQVRRLEERLEKLSRPPPPPSRENPAKPPEDPAKPPEDPDVQRLRKRLAKYRGKLTTFLHRPEVDPTNNAAERALRPAVVLRKTTGGSRSVAGAKAWSILASIMRTSEQQGKDVADTLRRLLRAEWAGQLDNVLL